MGDHIRMPRLATPDFSGVGEAFEGVRNPLGNLNPFDMGNDWLVDQLVNDEPDATHRGMGPHREPRVGEYTPEYVAQHRSELGMSGNTPDRDFINEFIAHSVTGESDDSPAIGDNERRSVHVARMHALEERDGPLTAEERDDLTNFQEQSALLRSWGMNPEVTADNEVFDPETGLYAVRYDALEEGDADYNSEARSVTSFAGTHSTNDLRSDADREVGSLHYEGHEDEIRGLLQGGDRDGVITGHSLGGYLAQRAAVDNADSVGEVVTFQAGGLSHEHARQFEQNRGDTQVRHHSSNNDFVHLAGEERLRGDTFHHHTDEAAFGHVRNLMAPEANGDRAMHSIGVDEGTTDGWDHQDRHIMELGRRTASAGRHALGMTFDPLWYAHEDLLSSGGAALDHAGNALDIAGDGAGRVFDHAGDAGRNVLDAATDLDATRTLDAMAQGAGQLGSDVLNTGSALAGEAVDTVGDLGRRQLRSTRRIAEHVGEQGVELARDGIANAGTLGEIAVESTRRQAQLAFAGVEAAGQARDAVWNAGAETLGSVGDTASDVWNSLWD